MRKTFCLSLLIAAMLCLAACQPTPESAVVASKNDGAFEAALENKTEDTEMAATAEETTQHYTSSFTSADGNVTYNVDVELLVPQTALPVLQVTPHSFTADEAKQIATALFGNAEIYEYSNERSKSEIEAEILSLRQHISDRDALVEYYGGEEALADMVTEDYNNRIAILEAQYDSAPETVEPEVCRWEFHPQSYYDDAALGLAFEDGYDDTQALKATVWLDGMPYVYWVTNREAADYRIHRISAFVDDLYVPEVERFSAEKVTQEDIDSAVETAERVLASLGRGTWEIDSCFADELSMREQSVYSVSVYACPVYNGVKATRLPQLGSLKSEDAYASNYYFEEISFQFSGGRMIAFEYTGALDVVSVLNENVATLPVDEIMNAFEAHTKLDDIKGYQIGGIPEELVDQVPQVVSVTAQVDSVSFGLVRTRIKNNESDFYLLPAYTFSGDYSCTYSNGMEAPGEGAMLTTVNAVDGSIINTKLGY